MNYQRNTALYTILFAGHFITCILTFHSKDILDVGIFENITFYRSTNIRIFHSFAQMFS